LFSGLELKSFTTTTSFWRTSFTLIQLLRSGEWWINEQVVMLVLWWSLLSVPIDGQSRWLSDCCWSLSFRLRCGRSPQEMVELKRCQDLFEEKNEKTHFTKESWINWID